MKYPPPTDAQLRAAFEVLHASAPAVWAAGFEAAMQSPIGSRIVRARAMQQIAADDRRARAQKPLRYQRADGTWRTRMVYAGRTDQLAITEKAPS